MRLNCGDPNSKCAFSSMTLPKLDGESHVAETDCFTTLHIRPHPRNDLADIASRGFMRDGAREIGDEAIPERLGALAYLSDLGLIHDAPALHRGCLGEMERELKLEIDTLKRLKGEASPIFCLYLAGLRSEGIDRVGIEGTQT
ncbi:hypothetical protein LA080_009647 [Diaporthe eres]|nr:hypothetical protein LA080_009647 [Diaporthe eres]